MTVTAFVCSRVLPGGGVLKTQYGPCHEVWVLSTQPEGRFYLSPRHLCSCFRQLIPRRKYANSCSSRFLQCASEDWAKCLFTFTLLVWEGTLVARLKAKVAVIPRNFFFHFISFSFFASELFLEERTKFWFIISFEAVWHQAVSWTQGYPIEKRYPTQFWQSLCNVSASCIFKTHKVEEKASEMLIARTAQSQKLLCRKESSVAIATVAGLFRGPPHAQVINAHCLAPPSSSNKPTCHRGLTVVPACLCGGWKQSATGRNCKPFSTSWCKA